MSPGSRALSPVVGVLFQEELSFSELQSKSLVRALLSLLGEHAKLEC